MKALKQLQVKIFADGADKAGMLKMNAQSFIQGFTTNPSLMRQAGISDYKAFAREMLTEIKEKPISFEVFSDDFADMQRQALEIASWGDNVYVKIPVTNTRQEATYPLINTLAGQQVKINVTAIMTLSQLNQVVEVLHPQVPSYLSVFAGRIADTGQDPLSFMATASKLVQTVPAAELIWASSRQLFDIFQADKSGCHIITVTNELLKKLPLLGYDLTSYSLDTVKMFHQDALEAGFTL